MSRLPSRLKSPTAPPIPAHETRLDAQSGTHRYVAKTALAGVGVKDGRVLAEVRFEDVEIAVQVEVADRATHPSSRNASRRPVRNAPLRRENGPCRRWRKGRTCPRGSAF